MKLIKNIKNLKIKNIFKKNKQINNKDLFLSGKIFEAKDNVLDKTLKNLYLKKHFEDKDLIKAITISTIKNNKSNNYWSMLGIIISLFIVYLTVQTLNEVKKQTHYVEFSTKAGRVKQAKSINSSVNFCKDNTENKNSGIYNTDTGVELTCEEFSKTKLFKKYKN